MTRFNRLISVTATVSALTGPGALAQPETFLPTDDNYVWADVPDSTPALDEELFVVWNSGNLLHTRKTYIKFQVPAVGSVDDATLFITASRPVATGFIFEVFGLTDSDLDGWSEDSITWNSAPANLGGNDIDETKATEDPIATFGVLGNEPEAPAGTVFSIGGSALASFIEASPNEFVTLIIRRQNSDTRSSFFFSSRATNAANRPMLEITFSDPTPPPPPPEPDPMEIIITELQVHPGGAERVSVEAVLVPDPAFPFDPAADGVGLGIIRQGATPEQDVLFYPANPFDLPIFLDLVVDEPCYRVWSIGAVEKDRTGIQSLDIIDDNGLITFSLTDVKTGIPADDYDDVIVMIAVGEHIGEQHQGLTQSSPRAPWKN